MKVEPSIEICASSSVSPWGRGVESLFQNKNPCQEWVTSKVDSRKKDLVYRVPMDLPEFKKWRIEARLRRVSPISLFMVDAIQQILNQVSPDPGRLGLVAAFSTGALSYSRKFFHEILIQGQHFASPILFPETVMNSSTSHAAALFKILGPCYSLIGDDAAWITALSTAVNWLSLEQADYVLVLGAEELDLVSIEAYRFAGWLRQESGFIPSEGCGALLLRRRENEGKEMGLLQFSEGNPFRNRKQALVAAEKCLSPFSGYHSVLKTAQSSWFRRIEDQLHQKFGFESLNPSQNWGQAFNASAAWKTMEGIRRSRELNRPVVIPIFGLNHQCSAIVVGNDFD